MTTTTSTTNHQHFLLPACLSSTSTSASTTSYHPSTKPNQRNAQALRFPQLRYMYMTSYMYIHVLYSQNHPIRMESSKLVADGKYDNL